MPDSVHPQDIANLILYIQTELAILEQQPDLSPASQERIRQCQATLQTTIDQMQVRDWYQQLTAGLQDQLGRLEEWF